MTAPRDQEIEDFVADQKAAPGVLRLPLIRHLRWVVNVFLVTRHYRMWLKAGQLPVNAHLDIAVCDAIWRGEK